MLTPTRLIVVFILVMVFVVASWSKLRIADEDDHQPQRWRIDEYHGFTD